MANEWQPRLLAFVRGTKVRLPRDGAMHFDAINASFVQGANCPSGFGFVHDRELMESELSRIQDWARAQNARPDHQPRFDFNPPLVQFPQQTAKVANTRHAIRHESRQCARFGPTQMHMQVPEARDEKLV